MKEKVKSVSAKTTLKRNQKGITLIALVVTIVVLVILAAVSVYIAFKEKGFIHSTELAKKLYENSVDAEEEIRNKLVNDYELYSPQGILDEIYPPVSKSDNFVGYYADIEGDGTVDGVIYADMLRGNTGSGRWTDEYGTYTITQKNNTKNYYISQEDYEDDFGTHHVLTPMGNGAERFYIMSLNDISEDYYYWYKNAWISGIQDYDTITKEGFSEGKTNTENIMTAWNNVHYGAKTTGTSGTVDIWGEIENLVGAGWFVPSKEEWSAFGEELGITNENYQSYGLRDCYWSSSLYGIDCVFDALCALGYIDIDYVENSSYVRLSRII